MSWLLAILFRPFVVFIELCIIYTIARVILVFIPDGRVRRVLTKRIW